jgi:DNA-binding MarR family transcriptional regulator
MQLLHTTTESAGPAEVCAQELLEALPPVMRFLRRHMKCRKNRTLSLPQFRTLALLGSAPSANLSAVADYLLTSLPTASRVVSGLVTRGLVARQECPTDRRKVELALTPKGILTLRHAQAGAKEKLVLELASLDAGELRAVSRAMGLLHSVFSPGLQAEDADGPCGNDKRSRTRAAEVK